MTSTSAPNLPITLALTVDERMQRGRDARERVKRSTLGAWDVTSPDRDPVGLLLAQEATRVPDLLPVRHERMGADPFAFYRGTAVVMAADLAAVPNTGLIVQLCGDAHLSNFGLYAAPDRTPVFDINDFDETHEGPFEWDVKRLATSFTLLAEQNSMPESMGRRGARAVARQYQRSMARFAQMHSIDVWYDRVSALDLEEWAGGSKTTRKQLDITRVVDKARSRDAWSAIQNMTEVVDGQRQFLDRPPVLLRVPPDSATRHLVEGMLEKYRASVTPDRSRLLSRYEAIDWGHKVVGVGSVGLLAMVCLLRGRDDSDLMALQWKQAQASVLEPYTGASRYPQHGQRVVEGQRIIQAASDSFLGWVTGTLGRAFYVRQLRDMKWSPNPAKLTGDPFVSFAQLCGHVLARAHARSGDAIALSAYLGNSDAFAAGIEECAIGYASIVRGDYASFQQAIADGRLASGEVSTDPEPYRALMNNPAALPIG